VNQESTDFNETIRYEEMPVLSLLGPISVGKSCLAHRYVFGEFPERTEPTIGKKINSFRLHQGGLVIGEVGGHDIYRDLWKDVVRESDMVAYCISAETVNRKDFSDNIALLKFQIIPYIKKKPLAVFITKLDILPEEERLEATDKVYDELEKNLNKKSKPVKWNVFGCSALSGWGIHNGITWLFASLSAK